MSLGTIITHYWQIIVGIIAFTAAFVALKTQNQDQERRIEYIEKKIEDMNPFWIEIKERLASIEATLKFITKN